MRCLEYRRISSFDSSILQSQLGDNARGAAEKIKLTTKVFLMDANLQTAAARIRGAISEMPSLAIVLGSGFQTIADGWTVEARFSFADLPGFFAPATPGHEQAAILVAAAEGCRTVFVSGRMHFYEGHSMATVTLPIRVLARCGVQAVVLTNAAGSIRQDWQVGDLVCLSDHINFMGDNPLRGQNWTGNGGQFADLCGLYSERLNSCLERNGRKHGFTMRRGVYVGVSGPSFETPAEIRMFERWGGDLVGMSAVPESIVARQCGLEVAGLSYIANLAAGRAKSEIKHKEVLEELRRSGKRLAKFFLDFCLESGFPEKSGCSPVN